MMSRDSETKAEPGSTRDARATNVKQRIERTWKKAYQVMTQDDLVDLYAGWAEHYDEDHAAVGYFGHRAAAQALCALLGDVSDARILDAGAGTGAAGVELARAGARHLTAIDLSPEMLDRARSKGVYERAFVADLGQPIDQFDSSSFDAAILVGVFSFGQAPAFALDEIVRVVRPGGIVTLTMRDDFREQDAMGVRSKMEQLVAEGAWKQRSVSDPAPYLPKKDPGVLFRVWSFEILPAKAPEASSEFAEAVRAALTSPSSVRVIDHAHIWDAVGSRLYNAYIERPEYYLTACEEEILDMHAKKIVGDSRLFVELGCGSARKAGRLLEAATERHTPIRYIPIDVSDGALEATAQDIRAHFGAKVDVQPELGLFTETLRRIPADQAKTILFFGGSVGNMPTLEDSITFLSQIRDLMMPGDRLVVGFDLQKSEDVLLAAYNAGAENRAFFVHMVRRMNWLLDAGIDLSALQLGSTYDEEPSYRGMQTRCMNLKVVTRVPQSVHVEHLDLNVTLEAGDAIQVGVSRKFRTDDVRILASVAGLRVRTMWFDTRQYFTLAELVRDDAPSE
jgi:uncharacterized SAM-dependent methyltransferase/ubiquinone/menaquinone biosynthesis C-methylase UbiE